MDDTRPLKRFFGPYMCQQSLGISSNSTVYNAVHQKNGTEVILRVMEVEQRDAGTDPMEECKTQLACIAKLNSPNLVPILDYGNEGKDLYIAMQPFSGGSLAERLNARRKHERQLPSLGEVADLLERIAAALDDVHAEGMIHGQVESRNIFFDEKGNAYLADTGLTRLFKLVFALQSTGSFTTGHYSAPEQWTGERPTPASDQYALACIAYEMLIGNVPFEAPSIWKLMNKHLKQMPMMPHRLRDDVPGTVSMVLLKALAKAGGDRYPSVGDFAADFRDAIGDFPGKSTGFFTFPLDA